MLEVGQVATLDYTFYQEDFDRFAALSGDDNPIHIDPEFAAQSRFGRPVAHGMLLYGLISSVLSNNFPAVEPLEQDLMFPNPTYAGETVTVRVAVIQVDPEERFARLETVIAKANGEIACQGEALVGW